MELHNPTSQSRLCASLGENLEPFETREVPDGFEQCSSCRCVTSGGSEASGNAEADS